MQCGEGERNGGGDFREGRGLGFGGSCTAKMPERFWWLLSISISLPWFVERVRGDMI